MTMFSSQIHCNNLDSGFFYCFTVGHQCWRSYLFAGIAHERDDSPGFIFEEEDNDFQETAVTAGFGLDWFWNAKNPSAPPFALSVELGLGYSEENFDDDFRDEEEGLFLAIGAGIHYQFQ